MDLIRLTRPVDFALLLAAVLLGGWLAAGSGAALAPAAVRLSVAALATGLIGVAANVVNDIYDIEIDRHNAPHRPLAAGHVTVGAAWALWAVLSGLGTILAFGVSAPHGVIAVSAVALLWAYAVTLKRVAGVGHAVVGIAVAIGLLFGAFVVEPGVAPPVWAGALLTFVLVSTREVVKAIPDIRGDRAAGAQTIPTLLGPRRAAFIAIWVLAGTIAAMPLLTRVGFEPMILAYVLPMCGLVLAALWILWSTDALERAGPVGWATCATRASATMKWALAAGVVALALGR